MSELLVSLVLVVIAVLVIWEGSEYFEQAAEHLGKHYGCLSPSMDPSSLPRIKFPEISFIAISTVVHGESSLGVSRNHLYRLLEAVLGTAYWLLTDDNDETPTS